MDFVDIMNRMAALILSLSVHEAAHAATAKYYGDDTAESMGRLSLNPLVHIDPIGTIALPLIGMLSSFGALGWAKPVPVDIRNLKDEKWHYVAIAAAGPISNLILSTVAIILMLLYHVFLSNAIVEGSMLYGFVRLCQYMIVINAMLAFFNLIPLAPLDGGTVFPALLPERAREIYDNTITPQVGMIILIVLFATGGLSWVAHFAYSFISVIDTATRWLFTQLI